MKKIEYFYADLFLPKISEEDFISIEIICDHKDFLFEIEPIQINKPKAIRLIDLKLQRIRKRIMKLTDTLVNKNSSEEELKPIKKETDQLDQTLNEIKKVVFRMKKKERSELIGRIYHLKRIHETKQQKKEIQSQEEIGNCIISQLGWLEALKLGDCLCLSFDLGRNENAIADPSQIVIKEIFSSMISAQSYLDSVEYSLRLVTPSGDTNGISLGNSHVSVHGGFDTRNQGEIVKGQSREPITGILPLFICKENWNVARHKIRPVFGFMTTLNVLGYSYSQIASIPFLLLNKAAESLKTEFEKIRFNWIFETCQRIYQDSKQLRDEIILNFNNYLKTPLNRLKDVISNNAMFLAQCVVALRMGDIHFKSSQDIFKFLTFLIEEELRRRQPRKIRLLTQVKIIERCLSILNVDQEKYIEQPLKNYRKNVIKKIEKLDSYLYLDFIYQLKHTNQWSQKDEEHFEKLVSEENIKYYIDNLKTIKKEIRSKNNQRKKVLMKRKMIYNQKIQNLQKKKYHQKKSITKRPVSLIKNKKTDFKIHNFQKLNSKHSMASILRPVEKKKQERQRKKQEKQIKEHPKKQKNKKLKKKNNEKREEIPNHMIIDQDLINCEDTCVKSLFQLKKELLKRNEWKQTDEEYLLKIIKFNTNKSKQEKPEEVINEKDSEKKNDK
ncbi:hypothetical protein M0812_06326 [Anaeramoeba flamelloides]|uniref:Uncharacterized protein n=1 Tax=Anaeramoeba flamelloides TaxID=1746091 RepID=A0AAV8AD39_9EUKA|nr:hypothetical protein M0812_06326 [Anaeramoeba flamelloides]